MKHFKILLLFLSTLLTSCEVVQETKFETDGNGQYSLGFDFSEMMSMGMKTQSNHKHTDTLIVFSDFIESKKDSISKLSKEKQKKIEELKAFSLEIKADSIAKSFSMKINYNFKDTKDLQYFGRKLEGQEIKELSMLTDKLKGQEKPKEDGDKNPKKELPDFNKLFKTTFNKKKFTVKLTSEGLEEAKKNKDTTMTEDNPMVDMIKFKSRYTFPYRIKKLSNKNARILSDFKGVEITANLFQINSDPEFFNMEIEFEKD